MSTNARSYKILSGAAELSVAGAGSFLFLDLKILIWASAVAAEKNTASPKIASRVRRNRHLFAKNSDSWCGYRTGLLDSASSLYTRRGQRPSITRTKGQVYAKFVLPPRFPFRSESRPSLWVAQRRSANYRFFGNSVTSIPPNSPYYTGLSRYPERPKMDNKISGNRLLVE